MLAPKPEISAWLEKNGRSVWFATCVAVLGVFTGAFGSLYAEEIKSAFPFYWGRGPLRLEAVGFWFLIIATAVLFSWRQKSIDQARRDAESRLTNEASRFETLLRTLPPQDFLEAFKKNYSTCSTMVYELLRGDEATRTAEVASDTAIMILKAMAGLARHFDGTPEGVIYAANLMTFVPADGIPNPAPADLDNRVKFLGGPFAERRGEVAGLLELRLRYSIRIVPPDIERPDSILRPLALPIPRMAQTIASRWRTLPGAPLAFCSRQPNCYQDTTTMADFCSQQGDFLPSVIEEVRDFFRRESSPHIRSLVSLPIILRDDASLAVVNIHRDRPGILRRPEAQVLFFNLIGGFSQLLAYVLALPNFPIAEDSP